MIERLIDVGSFRLFMREMGEELPAVVLENGIGGTISYWRDVQSRVAKTARVVSYDRAGNGKSQKSPLARDCRNMAEELHTLLNKACITPPYVLACASYGGFIGRAFANFYPDELAGLVLVEPSHEDFMNGMKSNRTQKEWSDYMQSVELMISLSSEGTKDEWAFFEHNSELVRDYAFPEHIPVTILTSTRLGEKEKGLMNLKREDIEIKYNLHKEWAANRPNVKQIVTEESGHDICIELPELVVEAIVEMAGIIKERI